MPSYWPRLVSQYHGNHMTVNDLAFFLATHNYDATPKDGYVQVKIEGIIYKVNDRPVNHQLAKTYLLAWTISLVIHLFLMDQATLLALIHEPRVSSGSTPDRREEAKSIKETAQAMGLEISSYVDWVRAERRLVRPLGALIKWGWVDSDERQKEEEGHKFWCNACWKTELAKERNG